MRRSVVLLLLVVCLPGLVAPQALPVLKISANRRFFVTADGKPFFWLGDTGWLLLSRLKNEEVDKYLEDRKSKGFNVVQVMGVHGSGDVDAYGDSALAGHDLATPKDVQGGYWDHLSYVID